MFINGETQIGQLLEKPENPPVNNLSKFIYIQVLNLYKLSVNHFRIANLVLQRVVDTLVSGLAYS